MSNPLVSYVPAASNILIINRGFPLSLVVTTEPHGYLPGLFVTISIPYNNGDWNSINGETFPITIVSPTSFTIPLDSFNFAAWGDAPFVTIRPPPPAAPFAVESQIAQAIPAGETSATLTSASNVIGPNNPSG